MKVLRWLDDNIEKVICVICLAVMSILIVVQVFFRYVLQNSLSWSEELARYFFIWLIYIGISFAVKEDKHVCVDAIYTLMSERVKPLYALFGLVGFLFFAVAVVYYGIQVVEGIVASGQISPGAHIPMQYIYMAPVVGMALTSVRLVQQIVKGVRKARAALSGKVEKE